MPKGACLSPLFDGVDETLARFPRDGIEPLRADKQADSSPTRTILESDRLFCTLSSRVVSPDTNDPPFPIKSAGAMWLRERYRSSSERTLVVGDGIDDARRRQRRAGSGSLRPAYGYGAPRAGQILNAVAMLETFSELARNRAIGTPTSDPMIHRDFFEELFVLELANNHWGRLDAV